MRDPHLYWETSSTCDNNPVTARPPLYTPLRGRPAESSLLVTEKWLMKSSVNPGAIPSELSTTGMNFVWFKDLINAGVSGSSFTDVHLQESKTA